MREFLPKDAIVGGGGTVYKIKKAINTKSVYNSLESLENCLLSVGELNLNLIDSSPGNMVAHISRAYFDLLAGKNYLPMPACGFVTQKLWGEIVDLGRRHAIQWGIEDLARMPSTSDSEVGKLKRRIDALNDERCKSINSIDQEFFNIAPQLDCNSVRMAYKSPGEVLDRLAIACIRLFKLSDAGLLVDNDLYLPRLRHEAQKDFFHHAEHLSELLRSFAAGECTFRTLTQIKIYLIDRI